MQVRRAPAPTAWTNSTGALGRARTPRRTRRTDPVLRLRSMSWFPAPCWSTALVRPTPPIVRRIVSTTITPLKRTPFDGDSGLPAMWTTSFRRHGSGQPGLPDRVLRPKRVSGSDMPPIEPSPRRSRTGSRSGQHQRRRRYRPNGPGEKNALDVPADHGLREAFQRLLDDAVRQRGQGGDGVVGPLLRHGPCLLRLRVRAYCGYGFSKGLVGG